MNIREERRKDKLAAAQAEAVKIKAQAEARAAASATAATLATKERRERRKERQQQRAERRARRAALWGKAREHAVDLLIYPIALISFLMAAPAMASYGMSVYGGEDGASWLGALLPGITELSMWAFAVAVQISRHRHPDQPVTRLQMGVWVFGSVAFVLNLVHGLGASWDAGVVMGVVAVSGVIAHQLTVAAPPRSRKERIAARIARKADRKIARIRRAAVRQATAEIDAQGQARLVYKPGRFVLEGRKLVEAIDGAPDLDSPGPIGELELELAALIDAEAARAERDDDAAGGGVATAEPPRPETPSRSNRPAKTPHRGGRPTRPWEALRAEFEALIKTNPDAARWSARRIARELRCGKDKAARLRDEFNTDTHRKGDR